MSDLTIVKNNQVVTSSRNVARDFDKNHQHVLRDIDNLKGDVQNWTDLFYETKYVHEQNKQEYREYLMNRDGFTVLTMGFTGTRAMKFKVDYMTEFNRMQHALEEQSQQPPSLELALQAALEHEREIKTIKSDVKYLKGSMRVDSLQQQEIQEAAKYAVVQALGGGDSIAYEELSKKVFSAFWREFKRYFKVPRYGDIPKVKFDDAIRFIELWRPSTSLQIEIDQTNSQMAMQ